MLIHDKPLNEMPWSELGRDEIEIVYVRSVICEIDNLKIETGRPNKLARQVSAETRALPSVALPVRLSMVSGSTIEKARSLVDELISRARVRKRL